MASSAAEPLLETTDAHPNARASRRFADRLAAFLSQRVLSGTERSPPP